MFKIILTNGAEDLELEFKVRSTDIAKKWFDELSRSYPLYEVDRFTNWGNSDLISELNEQINIINSYQDLVPSLTNEVTQEKLNYLHKFFEDLIGDVTKGSTEWFNAAPLHVQEAVRKFNILIHKLEADTRTSDHPTVVVTFKDRPIFKLSNNDLKYFTFRWTSGTVYVNYCQTGKTILDVFKDNDKIAEGIRPQEFYSADFMIKFGPTTPYIKYLIRKVLVHAWLPLQKFKFKNLNLGMIPVADITSPIAHSTLRKYNRVKEVKCIK